MAGIHIKGVTFAYPTERRNDAALRGIDLQISDGEFCCIMGHSGCGKTSLLNVMAGLLRPEAGSVCSNGRPLCGPGADRAVVFQHSGLFPWMTATENVVFGIRQTHKGMPKRQALERAGQYMQMVGLSGVGGKYPHQLSGGMQQRTALARALAIDAEVLLLDEPFASLDTKNKAELQKLLQELWGSGDKRKTVVFVTHDIEEGLLLADRIVYMDNGRIEKEISLPFAHPRTSEDMAHEPQAREIKEKLVEWFYRSKETSHEES